MVTIITADSSNASGLLNLFLIKCPPDILKNVWFTNFSIAHHTKNWIRITRGLSYFAIFLPTLQFSVLDTGRLTLYANSREFAGGRKYAALEKEKGNSPMAGRGGISNLCAGNDRAFGIRGYSTPGTAHAGSKRQWRRDDAGGRL
jgi:hypothetical protein